MSSTTVGDNSSSSSYTKKDVANVMFGIIKAMLGTGLLAMPSGLAAITDYPSGLIPANILCATLGILSGYTFSLYGRLTHATQAKSIGELWSKIHSSSSSSDTRKMSGKVVSMASLAYCFGCALTFSLVIGSSLSSLLRGAPFTANALPAWALTRQASILGVTSLALFPLCNLSSLTALAPVSILGVVGTLVTVLFMGWRCPAIFPNSPYAVPFAGMLANVPSHLQPSFCTYSHIVSPAPLILIAMGCVALMAHFSAPEFYHELASKTRPGEISGKPNDKPLKDFNFVTVLSYASVVIINGMSMAFGFLTFGSKFARRNCALVFEHDSLIATILECFLDRQL
jgi:sodium-coupled neutral amino acid transporter 11